MKSKLQTVLKRQAVQPNDSGPLRITASAGGVSPRRPGLMMSELIVALLLLAICISVLGPGVGWSLKQRKLASQRQIGQLELLNQLEQLSALPWEDLTVEKLSSLKISAETLSQLPDAVLSAELTNVADPIEARVVRLSLGWKMFNGTTVRPVELSSIIHHREGS